MFLIIKKIEEMYGCKVISFNPLNQVYVFNLKRGRYVLYIPDAVLIP